MKLVKGMTVLTAAILLAACGGSGSSSSDSNDNDDNGGGTPTVLNTYDFPSKLISGDSSVSYSGQASRHALINEIKNLISSDEFQTAADKETALGMLDAVYAKGTKDVTGNLVSTNVYTGDSPQPTPVNISIETGLTLNQSDYSIISGDKNLQGKIAGKDNLLSAGEFIGWNIDTSGGDDAEKGSGVNAAPELLIQQWFDTLAELAGDGDPETNYVTDELLDLQQLVQKFLLGAVTYSQAAEDYLKKDKGLMSQNSAGDGEPSDSKPYTSLEHKWDEGFGYFGAARDYNLYTDVQNKAKQDNDTDENGIIDLYSEYSFGNSLNAVKRDIGSADNAAATDFSKGAMDAFIAGRALIQANYGTDPVQGEGYQAELVALSLVALENWEKAIAATVVHYINDVTADYADYGTPAFDEATQATLAKHWAEMKGFALGLQFSQVPIISVTDLKTVHAAFGEAPVLFAEGPMPVLAENQAAVDAYLVKLEEARDVLQAAYSFDAENVAGW